MNLSARAHDEKMKLFSGAGLYLVTSQNMSAGRSTLEIVRAALAGGVKLIQLREKEMPAAEFKELARKVRNMTREAGALLIINDRLDVAVDVDADGVHLGQDDMPLAEARKEAKDMIIGASSHSPEEALAAEAGGASYVNIGPLYQTATKKWEDSFLGLEAVKKVSKIVSIPFTVMGGIKRKHIPDLIKAGARVIAVVTAVTMAENPEQETRDLLDLIASEIDRSNRAC